MFLESSIISIFQYTLWSEVKERMGGLKNSKVGEHKSEKTVKTQYKYRIDRQNLKIQETRNGSQKKRNHSNKECAQ